MMHYKEILPFSLAGNGGLLIDHFVTFLSFFHDRMNQFLSYSQNMFLAKRFDYAKNRDFWTIFCQKWGLHESDI